jgi:hypothetical protein
VSVTEFVDSKGEAKRIVEDFVDRATSLCTEDVGSAIDLLIFTDLEFFSSLSGES